MQLCGSTVVIIIHFFCQDYELDIHEDWLKDGVQWEHEQKMDLEEGEKGGGEKKNVTN